MVPLNRCLRYYQEQKQKDEKNAPSFILYHDTDEYIYPVDTSLTILQALDEHHATCCIQVEGRVPVAVLVRASWISGSLFGRVNLPCPIWSQPCFYE